MRLIEVWSGEPERTYALFNKFPADENGFENPASGMDKAAFGEYVHDLENEAAGIGLKPGWVPATKYILVNDQGEYVGIFNLRHVFPILRHVIHSSKHIASIAVPHSKIATRHSVNG